MQGEDGFQQSGCRDSFVNDLNSDLIYLAARLPRLLACDPGKILAELVEAVPFYSSSGSTDGFTHITSVNPAAPPGATFWHG
jgi:hypothetical protein